MRRHLKRIAPLQAGKVAGILYAALGLLFVPFLLFAGIVSAFAQPDHANAAPAALAGGLMIAMAVVFPIMYGVMGFLLGALAAALYNLIARWVGGLEFEVEDAVTDPPVSRAS